MLKWLRRQRLLAALMITANPALIGSWAAAYHPCPVRDGAVVAAQVVVDEHAGHHEMAPAQSAPTQSAPTPSHGHSDDAATCNCIGQCLTAGIALVSLGGEELLIAAEITQHSGPSTQHLEAHWASTPLDRLPPSTAPPIA